MAIITQISIFSVHLKCEQCGVGSYDMGSQHVQSVNKLSYLWLLFDHSRGGCCVGGVLRNARDLQRLPPSGGTRWGPAPLVCRPGARENEEFTPVSALQPAPGGWGRMGNGLGLCVFNPCFPFRQNFFFFMLLL